MFANRNHRCCQLFRVLNTLHKGAFTKFHIQQDRVRARRQLF